MAVHTGSQVYHNLIGGAWVPAASRETFTSHNPADTDDIVGVLPKSGPKDVDAAVAAARKAFRPWSLTPAPKRAEILFAAGEILKARKEELARLMTREMGKVLKEARGDVQEGIDMAYYAAGEGRRLFGVTTPSELPNKFAMSLRVPIGVVAAITPWNFPLAIPTWKLFPALVCGNTVVFKPASDTPCIAAALVEILQEAGLPPGVLNVLHGAGPEVGAPLAVHADVDLVSFTGSSAAGKTLAVACAERHRRLMLEMGGKNPILVMEDADIDLAVDAAVWGAFGTSGQRCTAASRLIVHRSVLKEFTEKLVARAAALRLGDGLAPTTDMGPVINAAAVEKIHGYVTSGRQEGAQLLLGGGRAGEGPLAKGHFYQPTVFADVQPAMRIAREEIFGPVTAILPVSSLEEAIAVANDSAYGLSSAIFTRDVNAAFTAMRDLQFGITYVNASTIGAEVHLPFGGTRQTGNGHREAGPTMLDVYTEWKTVFVDFSGQVQKAQID